LQNKKQIDIRNVFKKDVVNEDVVKDVTMLKIVSA